MRVKVWRSGKGGKTKEMGHTRRDAAFDEDQDSRANLTSKREQRAMNACVCIRVHVHAHARKQACSTLAHDVSLILQRR